MKFAKGETVVLKSGGSEMKVYNEWRIPGTIELICCQWLGVGSSGKLQEMSGLFRPELLAKKKNKNSD